MKPSLENIIEFVIDTTCEKSVNQNTDIFEDTVCYGDDWHEMIDNYSKKFSVDISNYLWYFHTPEEGFGSIGGMFFKSPDQRVNRIKVTPKDLFNFAQSGVWKMDYPKHSIPVKRYDLTINAIIVIILIVVLILWWLM